MMTSSSQLAVVVAAPGMTVAASVAVVVVAVDFNIC